MNVSVLITYVIKVVSYNIYHNIVGWYLQYEPYLQKYNFYDNIFIDYVHCAHCGAKCL